MSECIFCKIVAGEVPCHKVWDDEDHFAFLSIYPNTPGFAVVIPKRHYSSYAFALDNEVLCGLVLAAKEVGRLIDRNLPGVGRTGMIFEGFGVDHVHAKLVPLHGTGDMTIWQPIHSSNRKFFDRYEGYISSHDGERMADEELARIAALVRGSDGEISDPDNPVLLRSAPQSDDYQHGMTLTMRLCKRLYLTYEARRLKRFLLRKGMEKLAHEETNIQMEGNPTLFIQDEDPLNRVSLKAEKGKFDASSIYLAASDDYLREFRRYIACCKLLKESAARNMAWPWSA